MNRLAFILLLCGAMLLTATRVDAAPNPGQDLIKQAQVATKNGKLDDALSLYEQVITNQSENLNLWYTAESGIAQTLAKKGDLTGAAQAAHLCLDGAPNGQSFDEAVMLTASIFSAQDKSVDRANQLIAFEQAGGKINPMDAVGYPSLPEREKAFVTMRQQAGDDFAASRIRAYTFLFTGKPKDALAQFAEEFRRCPNNPELQSAITDLVGIGLRNMRGHRVGLDQALPFVIYGPNGPDGKPGTADDLADPFAPYLPAPPTAGEGGLSGITPADLATLKKVRDAAELYGGDPLMYPEYRRSGLKALIRVTSALDGWGAPDQKDWYLQRALGLDGMPEPDNDTSGLIITGAELAARGRDCHLGGIHALWNEIDAACAADNITPNKSTEAVRKQFDNLCAQLNRIQFPRQSIHPLTTPATF